LITSLNQPRTKIVLTLCLPEGTYSVTDSCTGRPRQGPSRFMAKVSYIS